MSFKISDLKDTKHIEYNNKCRKLDDWIFINDRYCMRGVDCDPTLILKFENGEKVEVDNIESLKNC